MPVVENQTSASTDVMAQDKKMHGRKKGKMVREAKSNDAIKKQEQYTQQLNGLLGKERERIAEQMLIAAEKGNKKAVYLLLHQHIIAPAQCIGMQGFSPLHHAASRGHLDITQLLLSFGWQINQANHSGETPLHLACHGGHAHVVECLLDKGALVNALNEDGETTLFYASRKGYFRIVRLLLRRDADASLQNRFGDLAEDDAKDELTRQEFSAGREDEARMLGIRNRKDGDVMLRSVHRERILSFLDTRSLGLAMQVCFRWHRAADNPRLWQSLGVSRWELSLNNSVGLGLVAPMTGYRPTPRKTRPSTSGPNTDELLNSTGHLGFYKSCNQSNGYRNPTRPQTARSLHFR
ncbi:hypothetical protein Ae201684P_016356 [Aphanomyces euteiches]|uniref:F-box domain-containing protein n=1 Tax=Aphanomyces euteiches TaxID=100861 RepID=A0A6G0XJ72_9STRA|nr:hypothetical protein Ae201684_004234 [Aphanomyces euteiches]KAH9093734.1 hypothetical protein Ae201684P_016356 [Aphanomyces euteiches]KAH9140072.1 hypothetical protein AeRB84_015679 [Aphanomyces euteiches]